ncbi:WD40/YVTN/BNR-like repeat-containing protein [Carboxylicivirga sp. RSCT41]|uniref:WD40/YVTN/BNR-like repeat-containing protein n=1 Tax=Carboxylicivirga agarovorans TaxID=3417570 RepID=UPI003D32983D
MNRLLFITFIVFLFSSCKEVASFSFELTIIETPVDASIRGLSVVDQNCLWLSGSGGTILRSTDAGKNWKDCSISTESENDFRSIHAFDSLRAVVVGINNPAVIYSTSNGGTSWDAMDTLSGKGLFFNSLKFIETSTGLAVSDPVEGHFLIIRSSDGGHSWQKSTKVPPALSGESNFAASNSCIELLPGGYAWMAGGGARARAYSSRDSGNTWTVSDTPIKAQSSADGIYSIAFSDMNNGIIVGGNYQHPQLNDSIAAYTLNGGQSWQLCETMPRGFRSCIQYLSSDTLSIAIAMGKTGFDYSTDKGQNWLPGGDNGYYTMRAIPGQGAAYAAGADGRLAHISVSHQQ